VLYLTIAKGTFLLPKVTLIYDPSQRRIAAIPLPSSSRQRRIDSAGIETKLGMSNAAQELLRVILPADSAQPAIFFPRSTQALCFLYLTVFLLASHENAVVDVRCLSLSLYVSLSLSPLSLSLSFSSLQIIDRSFGRFLPTKSHCC